MSWRLIREVYAYMPNADPAVKSVAHALAYHANNDGVAWPSQACLESDTGYGKRAIYNALQRLVIDRRLTIIHNPGRSSSYLLTPASDAGVGPASDATTPASDATTPAPRAGGRRTGKELEKNAQPSGSASRPSGSANGNSAARRTLSTPPPVWTELPDGTVTRVQP